jgi:uncharacterized protein (DUF1800 family)
MPRITQHTGVLGNRLAAHLLRRATYGPTKQQILDFASKTPSQALDALLNSTALTTKPIDPANAATSTTWVDLDGWTLPANSTDDVGLRQYVISWMLDETRKDTTLRSKLRFFLHQNWMVDDECWNSKDLYDHIKLLDFYALGSYKELAKKMCTDNRMSIFLNGNSNTGGNPNENFGREFLELFTITKGPQIAAGNYTNYTENDIKEAAKVFSGWQYTINNTITDTTTGLRRANANVGRHNQGNKTFSSALTGTGATATITGTNTQAGMATEISNFVNLVFGNINCAKAIARKLYRFFVHRNITTAIENDIITPVANALYDNNSANNYNLAAAVRLLLESEHFYDLDDSITTDNRVGAMVKSPLELLFQACNFFNLSPHTYTGATPWTIWSDFYSNSVRYSFCKNADMYIFNAPTVAGYPAYYLAPKFDRFWFDTSSITQRYFVAKCLLEDLRHPYQSWGRFGVKLDFVQWVRNTNNISNPSIAATLVNELVDYLLPETITATRRAYFTNIVTNNLSQANWASEWSTAVTNNNFTNVKPRLEKLLKAILYSQEYQLK